MLHIYHPSQRQVATTPTTRSYATVATVIQYSQPHAYKYFRTGLPVVVSIQLF
jgi:hypothetical protein